MCSVELISTNTTLYESKNDLKAAEPGAKSARLGRGSSRDGAGDVRRWQREGPHRTVLGRVGPRTRKSRVSEPPRAPHVTGSGPGHARREATAGRRKGSWVGSLGARAARRGAGRRVERAQEAPDAAASPTRKKKGMKGICV